MKFTYGISSKEPINVRLKCTLHHCGCRCSNFIWISKKLKLIYFEIPKAGCTSILSTFDLGEDWLPLHFSMAYLIHSQRYCSDPKNINRTLLTLHDSYGFTMTQEEFKNAFMSAIHNVSEGRIWSKPTGKFDFFHFWGPPEQAINLFPDYRKFIVLRDPIDRLLSAWNMFYNSSDWRLQERVSQCETAFEEKKSFRYFLANIRKCPNHHFNSIGNFVPFNTLLENNIDIIPFENLTPFWESIRREYSLPPLPRLNAAKNHPEAGISRTELLKNKEFTSYYSEDYKLISLLKRKPQFTRAY